MAYTFKHFPKGSIIGTGAFVFRHFGAETPLTFTPILPDDTTTYPMYRDDTVLEFAVTDGTRFGYYAPSIHRFTAESGMTGTVIERVEYVQGDNSAWCVTDHHMNSADVWKMRFSLFATAGNIGGCYSGSDATDNFCLYASGSTIKWYMRYGDTNNRDFAVGSGWHNFEANSTGVKVDGNQVESWEPASFTCSAPMCIGWLYGSTSAKMKGRLAYFEIVDKWKYLPVKVGSDYLLFDVLGWAFPQQNGTWTGGAVISEEIPFPTEIPDDAPAMLMMGGNPFSPPEPDEEENEETEE